MNNPDTNLIDVIIRDHREVEQCFQQLESGTLNLEQRRDLMDHVIAELVRHSVAEEMYMYPAAREALPDGDKLADHELEEHAEAEKVMAQLDGLDADSADFPILTRQLVTDIRHHISEEERDLLPRLKESCTDEQLADLGKKVLDAKEIAPTRPHPLAPDTPPANKLLAPGTGLVDKMRDALTGRAT